MSTLKATNIQHASSASANLVLDSSGNVTGAGTLAMASSFLRNRIINGDMRIDQRNAGAAVTINSASFTYIMDRWSSRGVASDGVFTVQQVADAPSGFVNSAKITVTTADASIPATGLYIFQQPIEGTNVADFAFGTASARTITLSFWVKSSLTGTFGGTIRNGAADRSYPFTYSVSSAATWEYKTVTIPGDTTGTWGTDSASAFNVLFTIGAGADRLGTAGAWAAANYGGASGATQHIATLNSTLQFTGVQLEVGSVATPFERRQYGQELALCQRYYWKQSSATLRMYFSGSNSTQRFMTFSFPSEMRAIPTISGTVSIGTFSDYGTSRTNFGCQTDTGDTTRAVDVSNITASAEL